MNGQYAPEEIHPLCWCGDDLWHACFRTYRFGLLRCETCGCYRINPAPLPDEDEAPDFYTEYYLQRASGNAAGSKRNDRNHTSRFWRVVRQLPELGQVKDRVADIGCGDGQLCGELQDSGWSSIIGLDVARSRIDRARRAYPGIQFFDKPLEDTCIDRGSLDLAIMDNVIEHLPSPTSIPRRVLQFLKPDGRFIVITPNMESGNFRLLGRYWTPELAPHAHIYLFTTASLQRLLTESGYVVETTGSFHLPIRSWDGWFNVIKSGSIKEVAWSAVQESGALWGRVVGSGPMMYAVARPS